MNQAAIERQQRAQQRRTQRRDQEVADLLETIADQTANIGRQGHLRMPTFNINGTQSFSSFIGDWNDFLNDWGLVEEDSRRKLPGAVDEETRRILRSLPETVRNGPWEEFLRQLQESIYTRERRAMSKAELQLVKYDAKGGPKKFAKEIKELANKAYPGQQSRTVREEFTMQKFIDGLPQPLQSHVRRSDPQSFDEAVARAVTEEAIAPPADPVEAVVSAIQSGFDRLSFNHRQGDRWRSPTRRDDDYGNNWSEPRGDQENYRSKGAPRNDGNFRSFDGSQENIRNYGVPRNDGQNRNYYNNSSDRRRSPSLNRFGNRGRGGFSNNRGGQGGRFNYRQQQERKGQRNPSQNRRGGRGHFVNNVHEQRRSPLPSLFSNLLMICTIAAVFGSAESKPSMGFDCQAAFGGVLVAAPTQQNCTVPSPSRLLKSRIDIYTRNTTMPETVGWRCTWEAHKQCTRGRFWIPYYTTWIVGYIDVDPDDCRRAAEERSINGETLRKVGTAMWKSDVQQNWTSTSFWDASCGTARRFILERGAVGALQDNTIVTPLIMNGQGCKMKDGMCKNSNATVVWTPLVENECDWHPVGSYEALIGNDTIVVESQQSAFVIKDSPVPKSITKCFSDEIYLTTTGLVVISEATLEPKPTPGLKRRLRRDVNDDFCVPKGINLVTHDNNRLDMIIGRTHIVPIWQRYLDDKQWKANFSFTNFAENDTDLTEITHAWRMEWKDVGERILFYKDRSAEQAILEAFLNKEIEAVTLLNLMKKTTSDLEASLRVNTGASDETRTLLKKIDAMPQAVRRTAILAACVQVAMNKKSDRRSPADANIGGLMKVDTTRREHALPPKEMHETLTVAKKIFDAIELGSKKFIGKICQVPNISFWPKTFEQIADEALSTINRESTTTTTTSRPATTTTTTRSPMTTARSSAKTTATTAKTTRPTETTTTDPNPTLLPVPSNTPEPVLSTGSPELPPSVEERSGDDEKFPIRRSTMDERIAELGDQAAEERVGMVGTPEHVKYLQEHYDQQENFRRGLASQNLNQHLQFTAEKLQAEMRQNFDRLYGHICALQNKQIVTWWSILRIDPTVGMRSLLNRRDIVSRFVGDGILAVTQCHHVGIVKIYDDHRVNDTCYLSTPVETDQNTTMFLLPGSQDLVRKSPIIPCTDVVPYVWKNPNGTFSSMHGTANVTSIPTGFGAYDVSLERLHFEASDMYEPLKGSAFPLLLALSYGERLVSLQQQQNSILRVISGTGRFADEFPNEERPKNFVLDTGDALRKAIEGFDFNFFWKYLWIAAPVAAGIVLIIILAIAAKCLFIRYFTKKAISAAINAVEADELEPMEPEGAPEPSAPEHQPAYVPRRYFPPLFTFVPVVIPFVCHVSHAAEEGPTTSDLPFIYVTVEDRACMSLWDSGANVSYISASCLAKIAKATFHPLKRIAKAANGTAIKFQGWTSVLLRIADYEIYHQLLVAPDEDAPCDLLLGTDLMQALERQSIFTSLRQLEGVLLVGDSKTPLFTSPKRVYKDAKRTTKIATVSTCSIPPRKRAFLEIEATDAIATDDLLLLKRQKSHLLDFEETVVHPWSSSKTLLPVFNKTNRPLEIKEATEIGIAHVVHRQDVDSMADITSVKANASPYIPPEADWTERRPEFPSKDELMAQLDLSKSDLTNAQKKELRTIVKENFDAFYNDDHNIGKFKGPVQHTIELRSDLDMPKSRFYRVPLGQQQEVEDQVEELLRQDVIEPSTSTFTSPLLLIPKKDKSIRVVQDFRALNAACKKQTYVLPSIEQLITTAAGALFLTSIDLISGYLQISLRKQDRPLTSFLTPSGACYQYKRMPMGLSAAGTTFSAAIRYLQQTIPTVRLQAYLDDLLIISSSAEQHLRDIRTVLEAIIKLGLKIKMKKCAFARPQLTYLGFLIGRHGVLPNPEKIAAVVNYPVPKTPTAVRSFLGMANYFRKFIKEYAAIASPLHDLLQKDVAFVWTEAHQAAFERLKKCLTEAPVLQGPKPRRPFVIESDASSIAVSAILLQSASDNEPLHPIAFASRKLNSAERNYAAIEAEGLALVFAVAQFRTYILGIPTTAIVDHRPLVSLMHRRDLIGRLAKFQLIIQEYDLKIIYRKGILNGAADALSRYIGDESKEPKMTKAEIAQAINTISDDEKTITSDAEIRQIQSTTTWIPDAITLLSSEQSDRSEEEENQFEMLADRYEVHNSILYQKRKSATMPPIAILPARPEVTRPVIEKFHRTKHLGAHLGVGKTIQAIKRRFVWTNLNEDVGKFVRGCLECRKRKPDAHSGTREPLGRMDEATEPFSRIHIDICGPFPVTADGNRFIFTIRDAFSRWLVAAPIPNATSEVLAKELIERVYLQHGAPEIIISDNGTNLTSTVFEGALKLIGTAHGLTAPYRKNANGLIERAHRVLEESLSCYVNNTQTDWDDYLPFVVFALNTLPHETTKVSAFSVLYGREPRLPEDAQWKTPMPSYKDVEEFQDLLKLHLQEMHDFVRIRNRLASEATKERYDARMKAKPRDVIPNDLVLVRKAPPKNKLSPYLHGPFVVAKTDEKNIIYEDTKGRLLKAHKDDVRLFRRLNAEAEAEDGTNSEDDGQDETNTRKEHGQDDKTKTKKSRDGNDRRQTKELPGHADVDKEASKTTGGARTRRRVRFEDATAEVIDDNDAKTPTPMPRRSTRVQRQPNRLRF